jgi:small subunit ribosomal protein S16
MGSNKRPVYRIVVSDGRRTPTAAFLEEIGYYNPRSNPTEFRIDRERAEYWLQRGAQMSATVISLFDKTHT